jgi:hypothetical protein
MFRLVASLALLLFTSGPTSAMAQDVTQVAVSTSKDIRLGRDGPTRIPLVNAAAGSAETGRRPGAQIPLPRGNKQAYLVLQDIFADSPPGVGYDVYLDLPAGRPPGRGDAHYVGTINFFDTASDHRREVRLNITDRLKALAEEGQLNATPSVTVVPGATAQAESQIGSVAIEVE